MQLWSEQDTSKHRVVLDENNTPPQEHPFLVATAQPSSTSETPERKRSTHFEKPSQPLLEDPFNSRLKSVEHMEQKREEQQEADLITEFIKLSKREVSAVIGPDARKINYICKFTQCRIVVMPVSFESINIRVKGSDSLQTLCLTGKMQEVVQAKVMLRRALMELKSR